MFSFLKNLWLRGDTLNYPVRMTDEMLTIQSAIFKYPQHWSVAESKDGLLIIKNLRFSLQVVLRPTDNCEWTAKVVYPGGSSEPLAYPVAQRLGKWAASVLGNQIRAKLAEDRAAAIAELGELDSESATGNTV